MTKLWGRSQEVATLHRLVAAVTQGRGAVAVLEGEPGIGKTRLLSEAADRGRHAGCTVRQAGVDEVLSGRPYGLLTDALQVDPGSGDPDAAAVAAMLQPADAGHHEREFLVVDRFVDLVERLAAARPLLLSLDDLQWADAHSLRVIYRLTRLVASTPVLLLLSCRPAPRPPALAHLLRRLPDTGATLLHLPPLPTADARAMAADLYGAPIGARLQPHVDGARGNPLFIEELVAAVRRVSHGEPGEPGRPDEPAAALPASVTEAIMMRIGWLDEATLPVLRTAAVLGSPFRVADLALVTGHTIPAVLDRLGDATRLGVLTATGDAYAFRHDLLRQTLYGTLSEPDRAALHTHVGRTLAEAGHDPLTVATQLSRGAPPGDPAALRWLVRAADDARPHAPGTAADLLDRAVALAGPGVPGRAELRLRQLDARVDAGPLPEAVALAERLLDEVPTEQVRIRRALALARMWQGKWREAAAQLRPMLHVDPPLLPPGQRQQVEAWHAYLLAWSDPDEADPAVDAAMAAARRSGDEVTTTFASLADAVRLRERGFFARAADRATTASTLLIAQHGRGQRVPLPPPVIYPFTARRFEEVTRLLRHPLWSDLARHQSQRYATLASVHYLSGDWDDALAAVATLAALADEQDRDVDRALVAWVRGLVGLGRGQLEAAGRALAGADGVPEIRCLQASLALAHGDQDRAASLAAAVRGPLLDATDRITTVRPLWPAWLPLCLAVHDRDTAEEIATLVGLIGDRAATPATTAEAYHARGLVDDDPEPLLAAVAAYRDTPLAVERAACQEAAGAALARRGHTRDAVAELQAAAASYEAMTAVRHLARVEAALRALGVRRGRRDRRDRPDAGWASLTPTERRVAGLVAEGLLYREIAERLYVSRRTVETHIAHSFAKLGVKTRGELAALARAHR